MMVSNALNSFVLGQGILSQYFRFDNVIWTDVWSATLETLYMTFATMAAVLVLGLILGLLLYETRKRSGAGANTAYYIVSFLVNVFRSIPFIILIVLLIPYTQALIGTIIGPTAGLPALILSSAPFYARLVETGFREVDNGVIEAAESMGASKWQIIYKVLMPESSPSLAAGFTATTIAVIGYTAMAGVIGAGGLGNLAYLEGFQRSQPAVTLIATVIILIIVFIIQSVGDFVVKKLDKR